MTEEERNKILAETHSDLRKKFPKYQGSFRFNLKPGREKANVNIDESIIEEN